MIISEKNNCGNLSGVLDGLFWHRLVESERDTLAWAFHFRVNQPESYRDSVLSGLRKVIESPDYSYVEKAAFFVFDQCEYGEVHAEGMFRRGWELLTDDPYPEHPAPLQMETMILEDEVDCSSLRGLLVCCFNRVATEVRRNDSNRSKFRAQMGEMGFNISNPNVNKRFARRLREVILDTQHTFVEKAKFFIRDYYQDGEEAAREIFKRIFADLCPREPNPLA